MRNNTHGFTLGSALFIAAVIFFGLASLGSGWYRASPNPWWNNTLIAAGLFCWALSTAVA